MSTPQNAPFSFFYGSSFKNRNRPHNSPLFNGGDASVTPDVVVQYHEWSLPSPTLHFIQLAHFGKRKRRLRVESPFVAIAQEVTMSRKTTSYITANLLFKIWLMLGAFIKSALLA